MRQEKVGNLGELDSGSWAGMTVMRGSLRKDNGSGGRAVREPPLRGRGGRDGSPHLRGQRRGGMDSRLRGKTDGEMGLTVGEDGKILA